MTLRSVIEGTGSALPQRRVDNAELAKTVDTSDEWIVERTGIRARHIASDGETTSSLATDAGRKALAAAGIEAATPDDVDSAARVTVVPAGWRFGQRCIWPNRQTGK